jgi:hypothetical protein
VDPKTLDRSRSRAAVSDTVLKRKPLQRDFGPEAVADPVLGAVPESLLFE